MDRTSAFSPSSLYSFALLALCALTFALSLENGYHQSWDWWLLAAAIIGAALIASSEYSVIRLPFKWGSATVSVGATCGLGISIWLGPGFGIVLIGATLLIANWRRWHQVALSVENASSAALAGGLAGTVWWWLVPSGQDPLTSFKTTGVFILAALIHVAVNFGTVVIGTSIARREPIQAVARTMAGGWNFLFTIPVLAALIPLIGNQSLLGLLLFAAPLAFLHFALNALWQLRKEAQDTLAALTDLLELRDPYTAFHSERVTDYAMIIAASLPGFTPEEREVLERASRIHDIGKVAVTDAILLKAGALTPEERTKMESHASVGARLIENMNVYHDCVDDSAPPRAVGRPWLSRQIVQRDDPARCAHHGCR